MGITSLLAIVDAAAATYTGCWMRVSEADGSAVARQSH